MICDRCQSYRKLLALSIKKLRLSFQGLLLETSLVRRCFFTKSIAIAIIIRLEISWLWIRVNFITTLCILSYGFEFGIADVTLT